MVLKLVSGNGVVWSKWIAHGEELSMEITVLRGAVRGVTQSLERITQFYTGHTTGLVNVKTSLLS